jgi:hypothetical protein
MSIKEIEGRGWEVNGTYRAAGRCPFCGSIYEAIVRTIPIECAAYPCPVCRHKGHFEIRVKTIRAKDQDYEFDAEIRCRNCRTRKGFLTVLKGLFGLKKIQFSLTGVSLER